LRQITCESKRCGGYHDKEPTKKGGMVDFRLPFSYVLLFELVTCIVKPVEEIWSFYYERQTVWKSDEGREFSVYLDDSFDCVVVWNSIVNLKICICARVIYYLQCFPSDCDTGRLIYETGRKLWRRWPMWNKKSVLACDGAALLGIFIDLFVIIPSSSSHFFLSRHFWFILF